MAINLTETSKFLSLILRHKPEVIGISLDEHGWADVDALLVGMSKTHPIDISILENIVAEDKKQRYSFNEDKTLIRANQGHSIPVDVELEEKEPPEILYHGTGEKYVASINEQGLIPKSRLYVHLSKDEETAVKVGQRHGKPVIYMVKSGDMYRNGYKFFRSVNGVWLTKNVPSQYLWEKELINIQNCENCRYSDSPEYCESGNKEKYGFCGNHTPSIESQEQNSITGGERCE